MPKIITTSESKLDRFFRTHQLSTTTLPHGIKVWRRGKWGRHKTYARIHVPKQTDTGVPTGISIDGYGYPVRVMQLANDLESEFGCKVEITFVANKPQRR